MHLVFFRAKSWAFQAERLCICWLWKNDRDNLAIQYFSYQKWSEIKVPLNFKNKGISFPRIFGYEQN